MPCWYFEKEELKNTPSRRDGVEFDTERRYRRYLAIIIGKCDAVLIIFGLFSGMQQTLSRNVGI